MENLIDILLGKPVRDMCDLFDERFPYDSVEGKIIKNGIDRLSNIDLLFGFCGGLLTGWILFGVIL